MTDESTREAWTRALLNAEKGLLEQALAAAKLKKMPLPAWVLQAVSRAVADGRVKDAITVSIYFPVDWYQRIVIVSKGFPSAWIRERMYRGFKKANRDVSPLPEYTSRKKIKGYKAKPDQECVIMTLRMPPDWWEDLLDWQGKNRRSHWIKTQILPELKKGYQRPLTPLKEK